MPAFLTPARRRGREILDDPRVAPAVRERCTGDIARSNRLLGGRRAALRELREAVRETAEGRRSAAPEGGVPAAITLLDVGTGAADIPAAAREEARHSGVDLRTVGLDAASSLLGAARHRVDAAVCGSALALPFADRSIDIVMCSQVLHHFEQRDAVTLIREMDRVARARVVVSDLRRSWVAAGGFWLLSLPLGFHRVTRHDGVVSVLRGFTRVELQKIVDGAVASRTRARRRLGFRLTVSWRPLHA